MTENKLTQRHRKIVDHSAWRQNPRTTSVARDADMEKLIDGWHALLDEFAELNGVRRCPRFRIDALLRGLKHGGTWGLPYAWPGCDHPSFFKRAGRTAIILTEPYNEHETVRLRAYADEHGLAMHAPPNPKASLWFPGHTYMVALTRPGDEVRWLPEQIEFELNDTGFLELDV